jgi:hypothetical protein
MPAPIPELSVVMLTRAFQHRAGKLPEGTVGTVVHAWSDGEHYTVEFTKPFPRVVSLVAPTFNPPKLAWLNSQTSGTRLSTMRRSPDIY